MAQNTQTQRRMKYGANVAVAVAAAIAIAVIINVLGYSRLFRIRLDLTATRKYSLSDQTRKLLSNLKDNFRIVTLLSSGNIYSTQTRDLLAEYGHYSSQVSVDHIDPSRDIARVEKFYGDLRGRYESKLQPIEEAITRGQAGLNELRDQIKGQLTLVRQVLEDQALTDPNSKQFIQSVAQAFGRLDSQYEQIAQTVKRQMDSPLPDYSAAMDTVKQLLADLDERVFAVASEQFEKFAGSASVAPSVKENLLRLVDLFRTSRKAIEEPLRALRAQQKVEDYDKLRDQIAEPDTVVILGPKQVRVVALTDMFRAPDERAQRAMSPGTKPELTFLGEERVTGALVAMSLEHPPLVVFIQGGRAPVIGYQGQYETVAQRLRNMNFEVKDWSPAGGRPNPYTGQPTPPGPAPEPAAGQKCVWIVTPIEPTNPMMGMGPMGGPGQQIVEHIIERLAAGDGVMFITSPNPMAGMGQPDPVVQLLNDWGISINVSQAIMREVALRNRQTAADSTLRVSTWPTGLPITQAISGMEGVFVRASPLTIKAENDHKAKVTPLVTIEGQRQWAETDLMSETPEYKKDAAADKFTIAAAAETGNVRIIAVADPAWATDQVTTYGLLGPGTAQLVGALFPANAELFVNSAYWLAHLDQLIAASARTQDIRRLADMSRGELVAWRWILLLGMPLIIGAAGTGVWLARRGA